MTVRNGSQCRTEMRFKIYGLVKDIFHSLWEEDLPHDGKTTGVTIYFEGFYFLINMNSPLQDSGSSMWLLSNGYFSCFSDKVNDGTIMFWTVLNIFILTRDSFAALGCIPSQYLLVLAFNS